MSLDLPHDIWLLIVSFVTKNHHRTLISVNRTLYNIVLDARYNEVQWIKLDKKMLFTLTRLQYVCKSLCNCQIKVLTHSFLQKPGNGETG
jgi:hypothetical protein